MPTIQRFPNLPDVRCRGEALGSPIYWLGMQWAVTVDGIERRDGLYVIERDRIHETTNGYGWEDHIFAKGWADMADFRAALAFARRKWPKARPKTSPEPDAGIPALASARHGKFVACTDTVCSPSHAIMGQVRSTRYSSFVEVGRSGSKGLKHLPPDQTFAVDVRELRGLIHVLRQAEASAVRYGLLDSQGA